VTTDEIYTAIGKIVNNELHQKRFYKKERELIFYRCNESENRGNIDRLDGLHGTFCITGTNEVKTLRKDDLTECGGAIESYCQLSEVQISVNIYSDNDEALDVLSLLSLYLRAQSVKDELQNNGLSIQYISGVRRLDTVIKNRWEYRAQMDITAQAVTGNIEIPLEIWTKWGYSINGAPYIDSKCGLSDEFDRLDVDCTGD